MRAPLAIVRGGGDIATGTIDRLHRSGFSVIVTEIETPTVIRLKVAAATAVYEGEVLVEGLKYVQVESIEEVNTCLAASEIPVIVDPQMTQLEELAPDLIVDATLAKRNLGLKIDMAPIVIALGPGFEALIDCHAVIETSRGHDLGRVFYSGKAKADTGIPGEILGFSEKRILRAPSRGYLKADKKIGDLVKSGELIGKVNNEAFYAQVEGVIRGLIHTRVQVKNGMKIGDVDPRGDITACEQISDKARALGGSVLEAYLHLSGGIKI